MIKRGKIREKERRVGGKNGGRRDVPPCSTPYIFPYLFLVYIYIYIYTSFLGLFPSGSIIIPGELIRALPGDRRHEERTWRIKCYGRSLKPPT